MNGAAIVVARWWSNAPALEKPRALLRENLPAWLRDRANQAMAFWFVAIAWIPFFLPPWIDFVACWRILLRLLYFA
jgi:hypothetical protein